MLVDSLLLLGIVGWVTVMAVVFIYYTLVVDQVKPYDAELEWEQHPLVDDEMLYFASSIYPSHEFVNVMPLPLKLNQPASS